MTPEVERSGILLLSKRRSKSRLGPGKIDTSISKQRTSEMLLRQAKILSAHFGQRSITASTVSLCGCVCGKPRIIDLRCEGCSIGNFLEGRAQSRPLSLGHDGACPSKQMKRYLITGASRGIGCAIAEKLAAPGTSIVNILSIAAKTGFANWSAYCMSKFALEGFFQSTREELREHKIRVINIYPAATDTNIWNNVGGDWPRKKMMSPNDVASAVAYALSRPADVALENISLFNVTGNLCSVVEVSDLRMMGSWKIASRI